MIRIEFQKKWFGKGKGNIGYAVETWWCFLGITLIHLRPNGIRGVVKDERCNN